MTASSWSYRTCQNIDRSIERLTVRIHSTNRHKVCSTVSSYQSSVGKGTRGMKRRKHTRCRPPRCSCKERGARETALRHLLAELPWRHGLRQMRAWRGKTREHSFGTHSAQRRKEKRDPAANHDRSVGTNAHVSSCTFSFFLFGSSTEQCRSTPFQKYRFLSSNLSQSTQMSSICFHISLLNQ